MSASKDILPVSLVGAGPGDPGLLTLRAYELLQAADVVVYDKLVSDQVLDLIPAGTTRIFAGKTARNHYMPQDQINELLVSLARAGRRVVRLKGGDPFVFGRGGEEAAYLAEHGVDFDVVPGITSSAACAAYAGIPLTHRGLAHSVRFVTGHTRAGTELELNWKSLADPETTLVVYMGMINVETIAAELINAGLSPDTPAAAINMGTRPEQRVVRTVLSRLAAEAQAADLVGATLLVIGKVVALAEDLSWFVPEDAADTEAHG
ncbi:MAG: uroporphyrinogen-III C-methyltransferase [Rhodospirillales bacterium]